MFTPSGDATEAAHLTQRAPCRIPQERENEAREKRQQAHARRQASNAGGDADAAAAAAAEEEEELEEDFEAFAEREAVASEESIQALGGV